MKKRKHVAFLFCLLLGYSLFQLTARAQSSSQSNVQASMFSQGNIIYPTSNVNWAVIPDAWDQYAAQGRLVHGPDPQIVFVDTNVTHDGDVSIRCDGPATSGNPDREVDLYNVSKSPSSHLQVQPGDHVVFSIWMKTGASTLSNPLYGAYFGVDLYGNSSRIWEVAWGYPATTDFNAMNYGAYKYVPYGTSVWTQGTIDFIAPSKIFTSNSEGHSITAQTVSSMIPWIAVEPPYPSSEAGQVWFADAVLYINPP